MLIFVFQLSYSLLSSHQSISVSAPVATLNFSGKNTTAHTVGQTAHLTLVIWESAHVCSVHRVKKTGGEILYVKFDWTVILKHLVATV